MATPTSAAILSASRDADLLARFVALGAVLDVSQAEIEEARMRLASAPVDSEGNTTASVYEYAETQYEQKVAALPKKPGEDPAAVTDAHILHAIRSVFLV